MLNVRDLAKLILGTLREMGQDTVEKGPSLMRNEQPYPILSGLRGYPWYHSTLANVNRFNESRWEEPFWDGIAMRLRQRGISAVTECTYPDTSKRCDLVVDLGEHARVWIEGKLALEHRVYHYGTH